VRALRMAGYRFTGTLTSPKVMVPDQNGPGVASSSSAFLCACLGSLFLLLVFLMFLQFDDAL